MTFLNSKIRCNFVLINAHDWVVYEKFARRMQIRKINFEEISL